MHPKVSIPTAHHECPQLSILVAEDDAVNATIMRRRLQALFANRSDVDVRFATDGCEAVEMALSSDCDIIFMDMSMPKMSGLEATRALRKANCHARIVACTAHAFPGKRAQCMESGMDYYLTKPFDTKQLEHAIVQIVLDMKRR